MASFLSPEWLEAVGTVAVGHPLALEGAVTIDCSVTGAPGGDVVVTVVVDGGAVVEVSHGGDPEADVHLVLPYRDAVAVHDGELDPSVAFMQGRLKTTGDLGRTMDLLAALSSPAGRALRQQIAGISSNAG